MPRRRGLDEIVEDTYQQSVEVLYPHLKIAILGPYEGDCFAFLTQLKICLQEYGFENTMLSTDRGNEPPESATPSEKNHFYREEANELMDNVDVGLFLFLNHRFERDYLSDEAREEARDPSENPREINMSVGNEIEYWISNYPNGRAMMLVEEGIYTDLGSRVSGLEEAEGLHWEKFGDHDISRAVEEARNRCRNWVHGELRLELRQRYDNSSSSPRG